MNRSKADWTENYTDAEHDKALGRLMADVKGHGVKHTPGPWHIGVYEDDNGETYVAVGRPERRGIGGNDYSLAHCRQDVAHIQNAVNADDADAHLIAAAPDLLAACESMVARLDLIFKAGVVPDSLDKAALSAGLSAIRKAGGEA